MHHCDESSTAMKRLEFSRPRSSQSIDRPDAIKVLYEGPG